LAPQRLRQIKREIRVLGVAARRGSCGYTIIGVVFRGSLWLDGVMRARSEETDITEPVAEMLAASPHSGQVRVILLSKENLPTEIRVSTEELSAKTGRPVILLGDTVGNTFTWRSGDEEAAFSAVGLSRWSTEGVLRASTREGVTPEALRLAALTLSALPEELDA
jgi:endonuclease V-like protein UPF0215 family